MNILVFSHEFPPEIGGAGVVAYEYANYLASQGHSVTVLTKKRKKSDYSNIKNFFIKEVKVFSKVWFLSYKKAVDFASFDYILLNDVGAVFTAGLFFNNSILSKSSMILHGDEGESIFIKPSLFRRIFFFRFFYKRVLANSSKIIAVSRYMKEKFLKCSNMIKIADKIVIKYNLIDDGLFFPATDNDFRNGLGLPEDSIVLLSVSRILFEKGYFDKIKIFNKIVKIYGGNVYWIVIGDGDYILKLKELAVEFGLSNNIIFLGYVPRSDLRKYYSNVDLFWLLSNLEESFGLVYVEAQACGCPVIARNRFGVKEAVINGKTGFLIDNNEEAENIILSRDFERINRKDLIDFSSKFTSSNSINLEKTLF